MYRSRIFLEFKNYIRTKHIFITMVKKFVLNLTGMYDDTQCVSVNNREITDINNAIHEQLLNNKNNITHYHRIRKWDKYKKLTNEYELVFTSTHGFPSIASYNPISRSYFKLWEILKDFEDEIHFPDRSITTVFLADAPGGFGEAFINYRKRWEHETNDRLYGMSLKATNKIIPNWKFTNNYCETHNLRLFYGKSGTGSLYDVDNIDELVETCGKSSVFFLTADGGFDFSSDFNNQEEMSLRLVLCEIYATLLLQKEGGSFVLKIYDIHNICTIKLLYILKCFYENLNVLKPLSSRPANSEKYVVCTNFKKGSSNRYDDVLQLLKFDVKNFKHNFILKDFVVPEAFVFDILRYNMIYITNQSLYIIKTLTLIDNTNQEKEKEMIKQQVSKALKWCNKYSVSISLESLKKYKPYYLLEDSKSSTKGFT